MSKNWIKGLKKAKQDAALIPRKNDEIRAEYTDLCSKLGHAQYQVKFNGAVIEELLKRLGDLDREAGARREIDLQEAKPESGAV